jgi:hypothetical protein
MSDPDAGQYAAGVIIALFSTLASALGLLLQKLAHKAIARDAAAAEAVDRLLSTESDPVMTADQLGLLILCGEAHGRRHSPAA